MFTTVARTPEGVRLLDQRRLPGVTDYVTLRTAEEVAGAIRAMVVRGAPAIGVTAAFGLTLAAPQGDAALREAERVLRAARPTAVNLAWALDRMMAAAARARSEGADDAGIAARLEREAQTIHDEDLEACRAIGRHGATLVPERASILTHCNAGGLATAGYGTALGVIRAAVEAGKRIRVLADETRPFLQGARLTAWELMQDGIETVLIADSAAGSLLRSGAIDLVVVGADRIARNGDVANKIGTYSAAVLAKENGVPFYVAAPVSTVDLACPNGEAIPIESRDAAEVTELFGTRIAPAGVGVLNPAFDVTPARYVAAIVTERGIARAPYEASLAALLR
ncbi:MAG TPA: S-methyl-5-thioribose-1-phosphate isomerase [Candidatus Polarisedimenticolaceae bacterium]|nr:S-methyl-5-thioribose-1-phosphate isomerase [Candidatus Polarisedimenticolaceae bacterium]